MINSFQDAKSLLRTAEKAFNDKAYQQSAEIVEDVARYAAYQSDGLTAGQKAELTQLVKQAIGRFTFCPDECVWEETSVLVDAIQRLTMGYLVICPTCGGKMSVNADRCPHCGETEFFKYAARTRIVGTKPCKHCGATGLVWRHDATAMSYNPGGMYGAYNVDPGQFKIKIGNDTFVIEDVKPEMRSRFETCIRNHDYEITFIRKALHSIKYDQDACPECNGNGKINDVVKEYSRIDLRKKV